MHVVGRKTRSKTASQVVAHVEFARSNATRRKYWLKEKRSHNADDAQLHAFFASGNQDPFPGDQQKARLETEE
ncbi:hypothetical protein AWENTII_000346 [Aspergillus wentii]